MTIGLSGDTRHSYAERGDDLYETPACATEALLRAEKLPKRIWEPACGPGAIVRVLRAAGHDAWATDLIDYESADQDESDCDFLFAWDSYGHPAIVTNPPYKLAAEFVENGLKLVPKVIMLLRLSFLESERRSKILDGGMLARVHVFRKRLPMMHRHGWTGPKSSSGVTHAWFVWDREHKGPTELHRISWEAS